MAAAVAATPDSGNLGPGGWGNWQYAGSTIGNNAGDIREPISDTGRLPGQFVGNLVRLPTMKIKSVFFLSFFSSLSTE